MKKVLLYSVAVLFAVCSAVSCYKPANNDKDNENLEPVVLNDPELADAACLITVKTDTPSNPSDPTPAPAPTIEFKDEAGQLQEGQIAEIVNLPSGDYRMKVLVPKSGMAGAPAFTRADDDFIVIYIFGTYTYSDGVYSYEGDFTGSIKVETDATTGGTNLEITQGEKTQTTTGETTKTEPTSDTEKNLCRAWGIEQIVASIVTPVKIDHTFKTSDPKEIAQYLKDKDINVDPEKFAGYKVEKISLSPEGILIVYFKDKPKFTGDFKLENIGEIKSGATFEYDIDTKIQGELLSAKATGRVDFSATQCKITITVDSQKANGKVEITLNEI